VKPIRLEEIVPLHRYEAVRSDYRSAVIAYKQHRRMTVGDRVTLVFEDRETLRFQIQEMVWIERLAEARKVQEEIDVYNELIPDEHQLSATLFIEITDAPAIRPELDRLIGLDEHVSLVLEGPEGELTCRASFDPRQAEEDRISAVQYLRFTLDEPLRGRFEGPDARARIRIDHPHYSCEAHLPEAVRRSLCETLEGHAPDLMPAQAGTDSDEEPEPELLFESRRVRALGILGTAGPEVIVEAREDVPLFAADPELLAEAFAALERAAQEVLGAGVPCRVWTETHADGARMRWHLCRAPT